MMETENSKLQALTVEIVTAYLGKNVISRFEVGRLIATTYQAVRRLIPPPITAPPSRSAPNGRGRKRSTAMKVADRGRKPGRKRRSG
jgi:predicted transcriptional regulator